MHAGAIAIPIVAIVGGLTMIIFLRYFENVERMSMISKGMNPLENQKRRRITPDNTLRIGLLLVGAGIGLLLGSILAASLEYLRRGYSHLISNDFWRGGFAHFLHDSNAE